jgi:hypothetical protein
MIYVVFALCAATSLLCAVLLLRGWTQTRVRLLLACSACFFGMAASHVLRFVERWYALESDSFAAVVHTPTLVGILVLLWGLVHASD